jgi:hypothetical protein
MSQVDRSMSASLRSRSRISVMALGHSERLQQELLTFPVGKHDDCVDALALIGQALDMLQAGDRPKRKGGLFFDPERDAYRPRETEPAHSFKLL